MKTLSFAVNLDIYNKENILEAIRDFEDVSSIKLQDNMLELQAESEIEGGYIFNEFMNYVISLGV